MYPFSSVNMQGVEGVKWSGQSFQPENMGNFIFGKHFNPIYNNNWNHIENRDLWGEGGRWCSWPARPRRSWSTPDPLSSWWRSWWGHGRPCTCNILYWCHIYLQKCYIMMNIKYLLNTDQMLSHTDWGWRQCSRGHLPWATPCTSLGKSRKLFSKIVFMFYQIQISIFLAQCRPHSEEGLSTQPRKRDWFSQYQDIIFCCFGFDETGGWNINVVAIK